MREAIWGDGGKAFERLGKKSWGLNFRADAGTKNLWCTHPRLYVAADLYELPPADVLVILPNIPAASLCMRGLPADMPVANDGIRILGE